MVIEKLSCQLQNTHLQSSSDARHDGDPAKRFVGDIDLPEGMHHLPLMSFLPTQSHATEQEPILKESTRRFVHSSIQYPEVCHPD